MSAAVAVALSIEPKVHDRRATDVGRNVLVAPAIVDDPHALVPGEKITVIRSLRDDPLAAMRAADHVDEAQYIAGRHWQKAYELAEIGGVKGFDWTKEAVDGGKIPQPTISDVQARAFSDLNLAARALGLEGDAIIRDMLGLGLTVVLASAKRGLHTEPERKYIGRRFREALETLAVVYGYAMPQN